MRRKQIRVVDNFSSESNQNQTDQFGLKRNTSTTKVLNSDSLHTAGLFGKGDEEIEISVLGTKPTKTTSHLTAFICNVFFIINILTAFSCESRNTVVGSPVTSEINQSDDITGPRNGNKNNANPSLHSHLSPLSEIGCRP